MCFLYKVDLRMKMYSTTKNIFISVALFLIHFNCVTSKEPFVFTFNDDSEPGSNFNDGPVMMDEMKDRIKRSVGADAALPKATHFALKDSHPQIMVDWAGEGSNVMICLIRERVLTENSTSTVFISDDYGASFVNKTDEFKINDNKPGNINKFYIDDKFNSHFIFTDTTNKHLYVTLDYGTTIWKREINFVPSDIRTHPTNARTLFAHDTESKELHVSQDFGETWKIISYFVKSFFFFKKDNPPSLYVFVDERSGLVGTTFVQKFTQFDLDESSPEVVISDVVDFKIKDDYLFAVKRKETQETVTPSELWISNGGKTFLKAIFPNHLTHNHYYIAHVTDGQIMVCVNHEINFSNLYVSSIPRSDKDPVIFSLSLERIMYFNPSYDKASVLNYKEWLSIVAKETFVDLHVVKGVRGVLIASQLSKDYIKTGNYNSTLGVEHLSSLVSFDLGANWKPISPPSDTNNCTVSSNCSLHLSQELNKLYPKTRSQVILSKKSAPGLILATGVLGDSLKGHPEFFISSDAAVTWRKFSHGSFLYAFGDHGGIIVAVQEFLKAGKTNEVYYSINGGETISRYQFNEEPIKVYGLMTEPGENSTMFTIFGSQKDIHEWIVINIDFKPIFDRKCTDDDYKDWSPVDGLSDWKCLLGRKVTYKRRSNNINCFNGIDYDRPFSYENCPCTREDFECDYAYENNGKNECVLQSNVIKLPNSCKPGEMYNHTKGYRKVPDDTCIGGYDYLYKASEMPCPVNEKQEFMIVSKHSQIYRYDLLNPEIGLKPLPMVGVKMAALEFDIKNNCIYWSDIEQNKIFRQCLDGVHPVETVVDTNIKNIEGMAFDWVSKNLYVVDGSLRKIEAFKVDVKKLGSIRKVILRDDVLKNPRGIAIHPVYGYMFFTDWSPDKPGVSRANLDGQDLKVLFDNRTVGWPNGITIDFETERIIWVDAKLHYIGASNFDGGDFYKIIENEDVIQLPYAIAVFKSLIYWDDWKQHHIYQADKQHGWGITQIVNETLFGLVDIKIYGHFSQLGSNACSDKNKTGCSQICMGKPNHHYTCSCSDNMKEEKIGDSVFCKCPDGSSPSESNICPHIPNGKNCPENMFMCKRGGCISEAWVCDGSNDCGDNSDEVHCDTALTCAPPSWQCNDGKCISQTWKCDHDVDCADGSDETGCNYDNFTCAPSEFRCGDGKCIKKQWVCDLDFDCKDKSDEANCKKEQKTNCTDYEFMCKDSKNCIPGNWQCDHEIDCADSSDEVNCHQHKCLSIFMFTCGDGSCVFNSWRCDGHPDCRDGSDEHNCVTTTTPTPFPVTTTVPTSCAPPFLFQCPDGQCLPLWWRCDNHSDCKDGADEQGCELIINSTTSTTTTSTPPPTNCGIDKFDCGDKLCIYSAWVCDGEKDCSTGLDEENCPSNTCEAPLIKCLFAQGCIAPSKICNGVKDCADGYDEAGCRIDDDHEAPSNVTCPSGFFSCDGGYCYELRKLCDNNHDCIDLSDETHCSASQDKVNYQVASIFPISLRNKSIEFSWRMAGQSARDIEFKPAIIKKEAIGNPNSWRNGSWTHNMTYQFDDLEPFTNYVLKIFVRHMKSLMEYPPSVTVVLKTTVGKPSPPIDVVVDQIEDKIKVTWKPPIYPNGVLMLYNIKMTPPTPPKKFEVFSSDTEITLKPSLTTSPLNLTITVTVTNNMFTSDPSEPVVVNAIPYSHSFVEKLKIESQTETSVKLSWQPVKNVVGYIITHSQPENDFLKGEVEYNTTDTKIQIDGLAPNMIYRFTIRAYKKHVVGPIQNIGVFTTGKELEKVSNLFIKNNNSVFNITWNSPPIREKPWTYTVMWGRNMAEFHNEKLVAETNNTEYSVKNLEACSLYLFVVMVSKPYGFGPAESQLYMTEQDILAPPKNLDAKLDKLSLTLSWETSCTLISTVKSEDRYLLWIREVNLDRSSYIEIPTNGKVKMNHVVDVHYGGVYEVMVRNSVKGSRYSKPIRISGPPLPSPYELTFTPSDASFFWRLPRNIAPGVLTKKFSYILYWSRNIDMSEADELEVSSPPHLLPLSPGVLYYVAVAYKDQDGYVSMKSDLIRAETPIGNSLVVSKYSVIGVAASVIVVIIALIAVLGILISRHRRLSNSFLSFANTHYDSSLGTTVISTNDHNLGDDDSPMIRGFSDDEPLIIA